LTGEERVFLIRTYQEQTTTFTVYNMPLMDNKLDNTKATLTALIGLASVLLAFRIFGPSDLDLKDQPKTVSYTLDIVENGRWIWPHDMMGNPATKPPFYNWLGAGIIYLTGISNELVLKMPTLLAVAAIFTVMYLSFKSLIPEKSVKTPQTISFLSLLVFISNVSVYVLSYVARPDMMLTCWLFTGWSFKNFIMDFFFGGSANQGASGCSVTVIYHSRWNISKTP
jgi:hypothetical protein